MNDDTAEWFMAHGGIFFSRGGGMPFYARLSPLSSEDSEHGYELTFNPEYVEIEGEATDAIVAWGGRNDMRQWLEQIVRELALEPCPSSREQHATEVLFANGAGDIEQVDVENPWRMFDSLGE